MRSTALTLLLVVTAALGAVAAIDSRRDAAPAVAAPSAPAATAAAAHRYGALPLAFVPNRGQTDPSVRFQAQAGRTTMFFGDRKVTLAFDGKTDGTALAAPTPGSHAGGTFQQLAAKRQLALDLRFVGANPHARPEATGQSATTVNYLHGAERSKWRQNIPTAAGLSYPGLWNGVDMRLHGTGSNLKYEFTVAPGASASAIGLSYTGASGVSLAGDGSLRVGTARGVLKDSAPVAFQRIGGRRVPVASRFTLRGKSGYGFSVGAYDHTRPLVIDPSIGYATFLGGPSGYDEANAIKVDSSGNAYVVGRTIGTDFPTTTGAYDKVGDSGGGDAFVSKLSADGSSLLYSTYLGGGNQDIANDVDVDSSGAAYVTGSTIGDFPVTSGAPQGTFGGGTSDAFVAKLSPSGGQLTYGTYLGGNSYDEGDGIAVDSAGHAYVTGYTNGGLPTGAPGFDTTADFNADAFVTKLAVNGKSLDYLSYLGGDANESGYAVAVDAAGSAYVTGTAGGSCCGNKFPTTSGAYQPLHDADGNGDAFVTKFSPNGTSLVYSTLLGGSRGDSGYGIAVDSSGSAYVGGTTGGGNPTVTKEFPTTSGAFDTTHNGASNDGFVTKLAADGKSLAYSTILGGGTNPNNPDGTPDGVSDLEIDGDGHAYVTGYTITTDFPVTSDAVQPARSGYAGPGQTEDSFATELAANGKSLVYSTYFWAGVGQANEAAKGIDIDSSGRMYIAGNDFGRMATTANAYDKQGGNDAFVARLDPGSVTPTPQCSDGADNDSDGKIDYPADPGCTSASDTTESPDPVTPKPQCSDGADNDSDGKTDYPADPGCTSATDTSESPDPTTPPGNPNPNPTPSPTPAATPSSSSPSSQTPSSIADTVKPALGGLSFGSSRFRAATSGASASAKRKRKPPAGTKVSFSLSEPSSVRFTVQRKIRGRKVGRTCKTATRANRKKKACTTWKAVAGSFTVTGKKGSNTFRFSGRIGGRALKPGAYRLSGTATDPARNASVPSQRPFTIIR